MKTAYSPDNTRSSIGIVLGLALVITVIAVLVGLSDKPQVEAIGISAGSGEPAAVSSAPATDFGFDDAAESQNGEASGLPTADQSNDVTAAGDVNDASLDDGDRALPENIIIVPTVGPTPEPTATPEVAAAVEPTPVPDETVQAAGAVGEAASTASLPTSTGTVQGSFFTKSDEADGAVVSQNLITVSYAPDGSGAFQGVLDITYTDGTHILLNMSGPITWAPTNPQVEATLSGAFTLDAAIDTEDIKTDDAELSISSLINGSGSLCTTQCFGFTFTAPS